MLWRMITRSESCGKSWRAGDGVARSGIDDVSRAGIQEILGAPIALGADSTAVPTDFVHRIIVHARFAVGGCGSFGQSIQPWRAGNSRYVSGLAARGCVDRWSVGTAGRDCAAKAMAGAAARRSAFCGMGGEFFFEPDHLGRGGISLNQPGRNGAFGAAGDGKKRKKGAAGGLTEQRKPFTLKEVNRGCPEPGNVPRFVFIAPFVTRANSAKVT